MKKNFVDLVDGTDLVSYPSIKLTPLYNVKPGQIFRFLGSSADNVYMKTEIHESEPEFENEFNCDGYVNLATGIVYYIDEYESDRKVQVIKEQICVYR